MKRLTPASAGREITLISLCIGSFVYLAKIIGHLTENFKHQAARPSPPFQFAMRLREHVFYVLQLTIRLFTNYVYIRYMTVLV
jgi:hypothetical protein